jgi:transcriptional regulator with XRE-family HTH domain
VTLTRWRWDRKAARTVTSGRRLATGSELEWAQIGGRLRRARRYLGLSQQQVADRIGIPRTAVGDIERGVRRVDALELARLGLVLHRPISDFLGEDDDSTPGAEGMTTTLATALRSLSSQDRALVLTFARFLHWSSITGPGPG